jgi:hypothetical protein
MKRRGWRVALTVATLGLVLVAGLVAFNWATVRDHAEAWWFPFTRQTQTAMPEDNDRALEPFSILAAASDRRVIFQADAGVRLLFESSVGLSPNRTFDSPPDPYEHLRTLTTAGLLDALRRYGYRILELRFPSQAYVVVGYPEPQVNPVAPKTTRPRAPCFRIRKGSEEPHPLLKWAKENGGPKGFPLWMDDELRTQ